MDKVLQYPQFLIKLSKLLVQDWFEIGIYLNVKPHILEAIRNDSINLLKQEDKAYEMIRKWFNLDENPTFEKLKLAILNIPKKDLLKEVEVLANMFVNNSSNSPSNIRERNNSLNSETSNSPVNSTKFSAKKDMDELSIENMINELKKIKILAACAFGKVHLCKSEYIGKNLVMKCIETDNIDNNVEAKQAVEDFKHEILLFKELNHERIVKYYGTTYTNTTISIVMEFMEGGSLKDKISNEGALDEKAASEKSYQVLCGLEYLHNKNIVHRDIKCANILLDLYGNCKLADFGISKHIQTIRSYAGCKTFVGTSYWMSPEVVRASSYGKKADIWSFGCTVLEMLTKTPPWFHLKSEAAAIYNIGTNPTIPHLPDNSSNSCKTFVNDCFQSDPKLRPNALQLLSYDWVKR
ncbi:mitogen-activated protein kinase kinase kinase 2-like isoform X2 [Hydra vulgaris]|uniref:Mitogen-activated protein kinase kinase kinase 2-like isoform X2 n=1 Tax=Hydra vulgaris TaxID=6087 RepID=A0ABM4BAV6_HYDVU